jgi:hypothetical protein
MSLEFRVEEQILSGFERILILVEILEEFHP